MNGIIGRIGDSGRTRQMRADKNTFTLQQLLCDAARKYKRRCQPPGKMAAAADIVIALITQKTCVIGMTGARDAGKFSVV